MWGDHTPPVTAAPCHPLLEERALRGDVVIAPYKAFDIALCLGYGEVVTGDVGDGGELLGITGQLQQRPGMALCQVMLQ